MKKHLIISIMAFLPMMMHAALAPGDSLAVAAKPSKAWEIGIGGSVWQFSRVGINGFARNDHGYGFDLTLDHAVWGGGLYVARELNSHFYLDLRADFGFARNAGTGKNNRLFQGGLGLQWRLGEYFGSRYIDPYIRVGGDYLYKGFDIRYAGATGEEPDEMKWVLQNFNNKDGVDRTEMISVAMGAGVNMWLNDRFGIGMQADYLLMPYKNVSNSIQGTVRLMWRIGGTTKKMPARVEYIDRPVDRVVERVVERIVEVPVMTDTSVKSDAMSLVALFEQIDFDFDSYELTAADIEAIDRIAEILRQDTGRHFLITGFTDSRGSHAYNATLSSNRAKAVVDALVARGVPAQMLKSRGVGKRVAAAGAGESDIVRRGDRKVTVEIIANDDYWHFLD